MINIIYANVTLKDIDDVQKKYRMEVPGTFKEDTKFAIRELFVFMISLASMIYLLRLESMTYLLRLDLMRMFEPISGLILIIVLWIIISKIYKFFVYRLFPIQCPCREQNERNRMFVNKTNEIINVVKQQEKIKEILQNEVVNSFFLTDNTLEIITEQDGYCVKNPVEISENLISDLKTKGSLDFSYLDSEWLAAIQENNIHI